MSTWEEELNTELNDVQKHKPPISASRVSSITKLAYKHSKHANDIAFMVENFLELAKPEYKLSALYLIDSICKAKKQSDRDAYVKRFSQNVENTVNRVLDCVEKDKEAVKKVINLWISQKVFNDNILQTVAQVMQQRIGVVPPGITIKAVQPAVGFDAQALLATIASQTPSQSGGYNFNSAPGANMSMNPNMIGQVPVGMGAPITNYANPVSYTYAAPIVTSTPIMPIAAVQHKPAVQVLDNALFDIYDDLEDDEQRIAEQKKRREEEEQKRREEQDRLFNLHNNQAAPAFEQPAAVQPTPANIVPTPASVSQPQNQAPMMHMPPNMSMQHPSGAMNAMPGAPYSQQVPIPGHQQQQGLPPPPNTYQPVATPQQAPNMGRGGGYAPPNNYGQFQPNPASGNFQQQGMQQQGFQGAPNQFNNGPPQFNGQVPPNMQGKRPMGRGRGGFNNYAPDPANLPTGEPLGGNMLKNKSRILFVGNLSPAVTEEHLGKIYSKYSGEARVRYLAPKHMAFVAFSDRAIAEKAKEETQGKFLEGRDLKVGWAMEFKSDDFNRDTGESTVPTNAISMYRADQFVVLPHNPSDVIPLEEPRGRGRGGFGRGGGDFNGGMGRGRGGFGRGRGLQSYDDNSHYGGGRNYQSQWSHPQQSGGDDGSDYSVKLTGGEEDKGAKGAPQAAGYGQYDNYYDSYYYGTGDQAEYYQQYYAAAGADPYAAATSKPAASTDDKNRAGGSGTSSKKRSRSRSRSRDRRRSRSRSRSRDRRSGSRRKTRSRSRSRSRDRDSKRRKL